jgi:hypothetical protein
VWKQLGNGEACLVAVQSAAVGTVSPGGSFTVGALGFSDDGDRGEPGYSLEEIGSSHR